MPSQHRLVFARLESVPPSEIIAHMSDPRMRAHMPLLKEEWTAQTLTAFLSMKDAYWRRDGLGHWAILWDGAYAGWGGFQKEGDEWDFGLVLRPECFGLGVPVTRKALAFARADRRIPAVTFLLPPSRQKVKALHRLGAALVGDVTYDGETFRKYRLDTP